MGGIRQDIPDGIYDNKERYARQKWVDGRLINEAAASLIVEMVVKFPMPDWGFYDDVPRYET